MTFKHYLQKKINSIVIFFLINVLALFVNIYGLSFQIYTSRESSFFLGREKVEVFYINLFCSNIYYELEKEEFTDDFWPVVKFVETTELNPYYSLTGFNGIFYHFDYSEFFAYTVIFLAFLFFDFQRKNRNDKNNIKQT